ncbi:MAG TPA: SDR family oxidoreductase [Calditrichia bacterium]|nr:SDR family oxidoreductase [Calditrichia bacterium]
MENILITGANRGIGLAITRRLLNEGKTVFATCRNPGNAKLLDKLSETYPQNLHVVELNVSDEASLGRAVETVKGITKSLDVLINNAGIMQRSEVPETLNFQKMRETFEVNAIAPMMVMQKFLDLLRKGERPLILNISSQLGSLQRKKSGGLYSYCSSKAALNMMSLALAYDLKNDGIIVITSHPGWVQTDMGGPGAMITADASAEGLINIIRGAGPSDSGSFLTWEGEAHPW